jgi:hypothetical protein
VRLALVRQSRREGSKEKQEEERPACRSKDKPCLTPQARTHLFHPPPVSLLPSHIHL